MKRTIKQLKGLLFGMVKRILKQYPEVGTPEDVWAQIVDEITWDEFVWEEAYNIAREILTKLGTPAQAWQLEQVRLQRMVAEQDERATQAFIDEFLEAWDETKREQLFMAERLEEIKAKDPEAAKRIRDQLGRELEELEDLRMEVKALEKRAEELAKVRAELEKKEKELAELEVARRRLKEVAEIPGMETLLAEAATRATKPVLDQLGAVTRKWETALAEVARKQEEMAEEVRAAAMIRPPEAPPPRIDVEKITKDMTRTMRKELEKIKVGITVPPRPIILSPFPCPLCVAEKVEEFVVVYGRRPTAEELEKIVTDMIARSEGVVFRDKALEKDLRSKIIYYKEGLAIRPFPQSLRWYELCEDHRLTQYPTAFEPLNRLEYLVGKLLFDGVMKVADFTDEGIPRDWVESTQREYATYRRRLSPETRKFLDEADPFTR